ncbi:hypothetical protein HU200_058284 [Digitaria exilis]|uniref:AIPP2-like SPOC-like domain-containing protein n=1 Tax=Digitaria exilis TaxID=1010633 RepID=A0A835E0K2_9POAL|nr:hypothetical protein HU200_058284 [Digitaria exilis]
MKVKINEVPKGEWFCEDCQADIQIEIEEKKLKIYRLKAGAKSSANYVENEEPIKKCQCNGASRKSNQLDAGIINTNSVTHNVEHGVIGVGGTESVDADKTCHYREQTSGGRSASFNLRSLDGERHSLERCNHDVSCNVEVKDTSNVATTNEQREMMVEEVPEEGWLCETCQSELKTEKTNAKLDNSQAKLGAFKQALIEVKENKPANDANIQSSSKDEDTKYAESRESKRRNCATLVGQISPKSDGLSKEIDYRKGALLKRGCSFNIGTEKEKQTTSQMPTSVVPNALKNMAGPLHGPLSKSRSFNSTKIPKVKQLLTDVPLKPKHSKEPSSSIMKQVGPKSTLTMSSSLKESNFSDPTLKAKTLLKPNSEEAGMLYPLKRQNVNNNRGTSIPGCSSATALVTSPTESAFQHLTKGSNMVDSNCHDEVKVPLSAKEPGTISLNRVKTSVDILASDTARKAVQMPYPSNLDYKLSNPRSMDTPTMPSYLGNKSLTFSSQHISPGYEQLAFTPPEMNHIWQGDFELRKSEGSLQFCDGLQAHLSCSATPKLIDLATKFPSKFQLEELPRHNVWPVQFQENRPTCSSIDLFFFARDIQSYKNYYMKLVENMIKGDLALRGNIETAELLIFASDTLSKHYQRWNMFSFMWGVLRVRRNDPVSLPLDVPVSECS